MSIKSLPIEDLAPDLQCREIDFEFARQLASEIEKHGQRQPARVVDTFAATGSYTVLDGCHRAEALRMLGHTSIDCEIVNAEASRNADGSRDSRAEFAALVEAFAKASHPVQETFVALYMKEVMEHLVAIKEHYEATGEVFRSRKDD